MRWARENYGRSARARGVRAGVAVLASFGLALFALLVCGGGCEALVPGTLEAYRCGSSAASSCPPGFMCATTTGACVAAANACTLNNSCTLTQVCDPGSQQCIDQNTMPDATPDTARPPSDTGVIDTGFLPDSLPAEAAPDASCGNGVGCPCSASNACQKSLFCADGTVLPGVATASVCTETCCNSSDCPAGYVCYGSGSPGNYCVAARLLGLDSPGEGTGGARCTTASECRSGTCSSNHCIDTCCSDSSCAPESYCALDTAMVNGHDGFLCLAHASEGAAGDSCGAASNCNSEVCLEDIITSTCTPSCCGQSSCTGSFNTCERNPIQGNTGPDFGDVCATEDGSGAAFGAACVQDMDCVTHNCDPSANTCTDLCCVDADCAGYGDYVCRPATVATGGARYLICVSGP